MGDLGNGEKLSSSHQEPGQARVGLSTFPIERAMSEFLPDIHSEFMRERSGKNSGDGDGTSKYFQNPPLHFGQKQG